MVMTRSMTHMEECRVCCSLQVDALNVEVEGHALPTRGEESRDDERHPVATARANA